MGIEMKKLVVRVVAVLMMASSAFAGGNQGVITGSEIPWPYSAQQPITEENSKGLWWANTENGPILYNVEIFDNNQGHSWMRVTEMDPWTYEIQTYGEGFFCKDEEPNEGKDGRFVFMFTHAKQEREPYPLHIAEVDMGWGVLLGLSIYQEIDNPDHILGYRQRKEPLDCYYPSHTVDLVCEKPDGKGYTKAKN